MKTLLTKLTESIGATIAKNINNNELIDENQKMSMYHISGSTGRATLTDLSGKQLAKILDKENPALLKELQKHIASSNMCKKIKPQQKRRESSSSRSSAWDNYDCSRRSSSSCGRSSSSWGSSCGSSRSSSGC